jgi:hypothetical protein
LSRKREVHTVLRSDDDDDDDGVEVWTVAPRGLCNTRWRHNRCNIRSLTKGKYNFREANSCSSSQEITGLLWSPKL